ncbi:Hypothetical_protein [Hexamita inflata]|uniref:Hypothetical_protein n=1 Tax=Hexamita inflata TaxID=28002 RepID=A0AA86UMC2_9EUKA|nr:Hypothetical protein HINF_LOCUS32328 [Hexamita inflata]
MQNFLQGSLFVNKGVSFSTPYKQNVFWCILGMSNLTELKRMVQNAQVQNCILLILKHINHSMRLPATQASFSCKTVSISAEMGSLVLTDFFSEINSLYMFFIVC